MIFFSKFIFLLGLNFIFFMILYIFNKNKMNTKIDTYEFRKDFLNYADKDGIIRDGK